MVENKYILDNAAMYRDLEQREQRLEQQYLHEVSALKATLSSCLVKAVDAAPPMPGVQQISSSPAIAIVRFSSLESGRNLAPSTYIQTAQIDAIKYIIDKQTSVRGIQSAIASMCRTGSVDITKECRERVTLNEHTLSVLRLFVG